MAHSDKAAMSSQQHQPVGNSHFYISHACSSEHFPLEPLLSPSRNSHTNLPVNSHVLFRQT
eukprot:3187996-Amphidinium_carterae.1